VAGTLALDEVRGRAAAALEPASDSDPTVLVDVVDSLSPPALMLLWGDPWLEPQSIGVGMNGSGLWTARFEILAVASRVEPGPGIAMLESLVAYAVERLRADPYPWPIATLDAPRRYDIANVTYLGARIFFDLPVTV
jgi:hypothetical protein